MKPTERELVMFGLLLSEGNSDQAEATAAAFSNVAGQGDVLGIQTDDLSRDDQEPARHQRLTDFIKRRQAEPWKTVFLWDSRCDQVWQSAWNVPFKQPRSRVRENAANLPDSLPQPFYSGLGGFSYGGAVNRLLLLALIADMRVLVRVDAGTAPLNPSTFGASLARHLALLDKYAVISGQYDRRIALRDEWLPPPSRPALHALIERQLGLQPLRQITGGACFALRVQHGPPVIAFPGFLPVSASDDGFFQLVTPSFLVNEDMVVARSAPGQPLTGPEYPTRLACAAALAAVHRGAKMRAESVPSVATAVAAGRDFLEELRRLFPDIVRTRVHQGASHRLEERAPGLVEGYRNYIALKLCWGDVCAQAAALGSLRDHCRCL